MSDERAEFLRETAPVDQPAEWYAGGLRFSCSQCGNCCTGPPGAVWFTSEEGQAMAAKVGLSEEAFLRRFARKMGRRFSLKERKTEHGLDCIFLDRESTPGKATCRLYEARPAQCRSWPFWPENLESEEIWDEIKRETPCPGMGKGPLIPLEEIRIQRKASE